MKKKVLIITGHYIPSVKAGGPVKSIKNLVDNLSKEIDFYILTSDRDLEDNKPFNDIKIDDWTQVDTAKVYYTNPSKLSIIKLSKIIKSVECDIIYLNSFFSFKFSILPLILLKFKQINNKLVVLAPRGEFNEGALGFGSIKKNIYIRFTKIINLYTDVNWHSTNKIEEKNIQKIFGQDINVKTAGNLTADYNNKEFDKTIIKQSGEVKIIYISRIHPMKNLLQALEVLKKLSGKIQFNIYGPIEDKTYWKSCQKVINEMPNNVNVRYHGILRNEEVNRAHMKNHVFLLLTLGENYGHVISEALIGGCPVIISDQTPWRNLEQKSVGWDIRLTDEEKLIKILQLCVSLGNEEYEEISFNAYKYGKKTSNNIKDINNTLSLFEF